MRRQKISNEHEGPSNQFLKFNIASSTSSRYVMLQEQEQASMPMQRITSKNFDNSLEAKIEEGDTLQAIALRFHCSVAEIKRLNKIDKDNEIYARKIIKIPFKPHSALLETLPAIHKSGQNSPKSELAQISHIENNSELGEKLLVASVNSSDIINTKRLQNNNVYSDHIIRSNDEADQSQEQLIQNVSHPGIIPGPSNPFDCSGSDCDISWICLFIFILGLCFLIPLIYVFYIAEHPEKYHHNSL